MSREFPDWVNPWKAAEGGRIYSGTIPLERMPRLRSVLAEAGGTATFTAQFRLDAQKRATIALEVLAELPLTCQASLDVYRHDVRRESLLAVVTNAAELDSLPGHYEATEAQDGRVLFRDLVEDELLLALPEVPRRPDLDEVSFATDAGDAAQRGEDRARTHRPFAALASLLGERSGSEQED